MQNIIDIYAVHVYASEAYQTDLVLSGLLRLFMVLSVFTTKICTTNFYDYTYLHNYGTI